VVAGIVIAAVVVLIIIILAVMYNGLVKRRNQVDNSWSQIDVQLKRRHDLIPNLVETVKGYAAHERQTLQAVTDARARAVASTGSPSSQAHDENQLIGTLKSLFAVAERYPDLKASESFLRLQQQLVDTEDRIQAARRFYNGNVKDLNTRIDVFPSNMIASMFGFQHADYFEVDSLEVKAPVKVSFQGLSQ
jgi:LemA protein